MAKGRPKINREKEKLERQMKKINLGLIACFEIGRDIYRKKRQVERKLLAIKDSK